MIANLENFRFGRLLVLGFSHVDKNRCSHWNCVCDCGNTKTVKGTNLTQGATQSCGCIQKERVSKRNFIDLRNEKFGRLTVVELHHKGKNGKSFWLCQCSCGKEKIIDSSSLILERTKSCGCLSKEISKQIGMRNFKDLSGKTFGLLSVISRSSFSNTRYEVEWNCKCQCGNFKTVTGWQLQNGNVKSCGCLSESYIANRTKKYFVENFNAISEYKIFRNPLTGKYLPYDIYIPNKNAFIEINGLQHYNRSQNWQNKEVFDYRQKKDRMKRKYARQNGIYIEVDLRKIKTVEQAIKYIKRKLLGSGN